MTWAWAKSRLVRAALLAALLAGFACHRREAPRAEPVGEAYVAPETLELRHEIALNSGTAATVKRGEHLAVLQRRRRFVKVRTAANQEGWTEQSQLLTPEVYRQIDQMGKQAGGLPSLGVYRARVKLNIHFEPYRWSPSFDQLKEEEKVDLLGRRATERTSGPPAPGAPPPASDKPQATDEWYLVRTSHSHGGWVLGRMMDADIPDEVAQYAEGRRITSYFPLSEVVDGGQVKKVWLWTTIDKGNEAYDFDSFRVFNWGRRKHRYETAHIERRLKGFFPVSATPSVQTRFGKGPGFSMVIEKADGQRYLRRYVMIGYNVRPYAEEPAPPAASLSTSSTGQPAAAAQTSAGPGFWRRLWNRIRGRSEPQP